MTEPQAGWRRTVAVLPALVLLVSLLACTGGDPEPETEAPDASPRTTAAAEPPAPPERGECHDLTLDEAMQPVAEADPVACRDEHTAVTLAVRPLDLVADGHLLAPDSDAGRERLASACPQRLLDVVGGDETTRRLARLELVWFAPTAEDVAVGADWVRCDVVAVAADDALLPLPRRVRGLLDAEDSLDRYGTCGTASPAADDFVRLACARDHSWRAVDVVGLPDDAAFLDDAVTTTADDTCQSVASERSGGSLELTWAFEWPTRAQWRTGQRWGWCWVPVDS